MRILYGVCGEGMGHATRSDVIARHLVARGHQIQFTCSKGRAFDYLQSRWGPNSVTMVPGYRLVIENNRVLLTRTLLSNTATHIVVSVAHVFSAFTVSAPDIVIDDFCAWTARYAKYMHKPLIAIDNIHLITRCRHSPDWIEAHRDEAAAAMLTTQLMVPEARFYFILAFTRGAPVIQPLTGLHMPVVRDSILTQPRSDEGHLVVYFNDRADWPSILNALSRSGWPVHVYGCQRVRERSVTGNVTLCPLSEAEFARDLASCHAVVSGAGFSFLSEALALKKPLLAVPYAGSFEQILNGRYLEQEGFGAWSPSLTDDSLQRFLGRLEPIRQRLEAFPYQGNQELLSNLDRLLETI